MRDSHQPHVPTVELQWPRPRTAVVVLGGEHDLYSAPALEQLLDESLNTCNHLVVELSDAEFIDSTIVGVLLRARRNALERGDGFNVVLGTAPEVGRVLDVSGVTPLLNVVGSVEQALAA
jgi:anti-sigma B factor antagonist